MAHRYPLKVLMTLVVIVACAYGCYQRIATIYALPLFSAVADAHSMVITHLPFGPMSTGLHSGDKLDLRSMDVKARYAVMPRHYYANGFGLPSDTMYQLSVYRGNTTITIPAIAVPMPISPLVRGLYRWISVATFVLLSGLVMLVLWRGRGRAAAGFTLWSLGALCGSALEVVAVHAVSGAIIILVSNVFSLLSGIGLYCLIESTVGAVLSVRARWMWRGVFIAVLAAGTLTNQIVGPILFMTMGWTGLVTRPFQILWAINYLVPIVMLFVSYRAAGAEQRLKLRWMLWSGALWAVAVLVNYSETWTLALVAVSLVMGGLLYLLAMCGFLYAVLRYRAVDVSVFIDHTLVYGTVTALVVGILAVTNSLVQHEALGTGASILVQIVVPLALGIVLGQVKKYADMFVERVFFRSKYLAGKTLRRFARHAEGYDRVQDLLSATVQNIHVTLRAPGVTVYLRKGDAYVTASSAGELHYPDSVTGNDPALAAVRAGAKDIDLCEIRSALGDNGYVFPIGTQAALVVANRPGEHYSADARKLLAYLARQVGVALHKINVRESLEFVRALARGVLDPAAAREQALKLEAEWVGS